MLRLAGAHSERVRALGELPGVEVVGFVPDLHALLASVRFVLSPVYSGDGVRMKNLVALAHGVPVVTNRLGARGNQHQCRQRGSGGHEGHRVNEGAAVHVRSPLYPVWYLIQSPPA